MSDSDEKKKEFKEITLHSFLLGPGTGIPAAVEPRELCSDACRLCWRLDQVTTFFCQYLTPNKTHSVKGTKANNIRELVGQGQFGAPDMGH